MKIRLRVTAESRQLVPISAAGLLGEQPLVDRIMEVREVGKLDP